MNIYIIDAIRIENDQVVLARGYLSSVNFSLFFPPSQFPFDFSRNEMINLIRQGNIFDIIVGGKRIPLHLNSGKNTVSLDVHHFDGLDRF